MTATIGTMKARLLVQIGDREPERFGQFDYPIHVSMDRALDVTSDFTSHLVAALRQTADAIEESATCPPRRSPSVP